MHPKCACIRVLEGALHQVPCIPSPPFPACEQELQLEDCAQVWWLRFAMDYWCTTLAVGTNAGKVLVFDPHAQQPTPKARLRPRRSLPKGERAPLVRQTAVSYDGSIIVACHEDGSLTRYDRCQPGAASQQQQLDSSALGGRGSSALGGRAAEDGGEADGDSDDE